MTPQYAIALNDIAGGVMSFDMWGRLGWREIKRRYRRTVVGPFWTTLSLALFVIVLGVVWTRLWNQDPKFYLPFLASGMLPWVMFSTICNEGANTLVASEGLIKQLRISYTLLACTVVWRNAIVFFHNMVIYIGICIYAGKVPTVGTLLIVPGLALQCLNGIWLCLFLGLVCTRFRDVQQIVTSIIQVALFITPIFWLPQQLEGRMAYFLVEYNILYHYIEIVRAPLLGQAPSLWTWTVVGLMTVIGWSITIFLFSRFRRRIPYWL